MSLTRAYQFLQTHRYPVEFPSELMATTFEPHAPLIRSVGNNAVSRYRKCIHNGDDLFERSLVEAAYAIEDPDPFITWCMRAAFAVRFTDQHRIACGRDDSYGVHRLQVLSSRFMVQTLLFADQSIHHELIGAANMFHVNRDLWECGMSGARAVMQVLIHMARPNRLFFFPLINEDTVWKIDLIILDVNGDGVCCQVKGTKSIDNEIHINELTELPPEEYLSKFFYGTQQFNIKYRLNLRPVVFTVGW